MLVPLVKCWFLMRRDTTCRHPSSLFDFCSKADTHAGHRGLKLGGLFFLLEKPNEKYM